MKIKFLIPCEGNYLMLFFADFLLYYFSSLKCPDDKLQLHNTLYSWLLSLVFDSRWSCCSIRKYWILNIANLRQIQVNYNDKIIPLCHSKPKQHYLSMHIHHIHVQFQLFSFIKHDLNIVFFVFLLSTITASYRYVTF